MAIPAGFLDFFDIECDRYLPNHIRKEAQRWRFMQESVAEDNRENAEAYRWMACTGSSTRKEE